MLVSLSMCFILSDAESLSVTSGAQHYSQTTEEVAL